MIEWMFGRNGQATILFEGKRLRNRRGQVCAWIHDGSVYSLHGRHMGWFEKGVLYDSGNHALGFLVNATGYLPSRPGLGGLPGIPGLAGIPGTPGFSGVPGRPGFGGWSDEDLSTYFEE
jgi:hypothetical protein